MCVSCNDIDYSCVSSKVLPVSKIRLFLLIFAIKKSLESRSLDWENPSLKFIFSFRTLFVSLQR